MTEKFCTHCSHANVRLAFGTGLFGGAGWATCPFRKGTADRSSGAPCADAFPEFSKICEHFKEEENGRSLSDKCAEDDKRKT